MGSLLIETIGEYESLLETYSQLGLATTLTDLFTLTPHEMFRAFRLCVAAVVLVEKSKSTIDFYGQKIIESDYQEAIDTDFLKQNSKKLLSSEEPCEILIEGTYVKFTTSYICSDNVADYFLLTATDTNKYYSDTLFDKHLSCIKLFAKHLIKVEEHHKTIQHKELIESSNKIKHQLLTLNEKIKSFKDESNSQEYKGINELITRTLTLFSEILPDKINSHTSQTLKNTKLHTKPILESAFTSLSSIIEAKRLRIKFNNSETILFANSEHFWQLVLNLATNLVMYSEKYAEIEIRSFIKNTNYTMEMSIHGLCIPEEEKENIFRLTETTAIHNKYELSLCKKIAEGLGGTLNCNLDIENKVIITTTIPYENTHSLIEQGI